MTGPWLRRVTKLSSLSPKPRAPNPPFLALQCRGWGSAKFVPALAVALCESAKRLTEAARPEEGEGAGPFLPACHSSQLNPASFSWPLVPTAFHSTLFFPRAPRASLTAPPWKRQQHQPVPHPSRLRSQLWRASSPRLEVLLTPKKWFQRFLNLSLLEAC